MMAYVMVCNMYQFLMISQMKFNTLFFVSCVMQNIRHWHLIFISFTTTSVTIESLNRNIIKVCPVVFMGILKNIFMLPSTQPVIHTPDT